MYQLRLIGYPIKHSLSPWIHEQFLQRAQLTGAYKIHEIPLDESLAEHLAILKSDGITGFNITVPYKETIISHLDELDQEAKRIGAVNTVVNDDGRWIGYNTDGKGYVRSLEKTFPNLRLEKSTKRLLLLGAGGAARGIYDALIHSGYQYVDIANRTFEAAEAIAKLKLSSTETTVKSLQEAEDQLNVYDVIIQTTSVGMKPYVTDVILSLDHLKQGAIVSDIVYQPIETKFLQEAKKHGARIHHGHTMLLYQAQYAFELWTSQQVSTEGMEVSLKNILEGE